MKISERIKKYREENHITQQELADKLYVSKQAISKWENDKSLPDVSMYPTIASLLNITVDELMGNEANKNKLILSKKVIIICSIIVCLIFIFIIIMVTNPSKILEEKIIINETEKALDIELPKIETYDIIEYNNWVSFNNYMYPHKMYYFIFKDEIIKIDDTWFEELPQEIINNIPIGSSEYPYLCDYYKLVDLTTNTFNEISPSDNKHKYVLYCLQIEKKRLIAIKFEV